MLIARVSEQVKPYVKLSIIGHVDHGKTTLTAAMVKVAALKEPDQSFPYDNVENPSAADYVKSKIKGTILVVSAPDGPMPQTRAQLLVMQQAKAAVIAVFLNKTDEMQDPELLELVELEMRELLDGYGFPGGAIPIVRGSALQALESPSKDPRSTEYAPILKLMRILDQFMLDLTPQAEEPFRMAIEDVFSLKGRGTVVTGRIERGIVKQGQEIEIVGFGKTTKRTVVTDVQTSGKDLPQAQAGETIGLFLQGIERHKVERGMVAATPRTIRPHTTFEADVDVLKKEEGGRQKPFLSGERPQFHIRGMDVAGTFELPVGAEMAMPGESTTLRVALDVPVPLEEGTEFAIRQGGQTVGTGVLTQILDEITDKPRQVRIGLTEKDPPEEATDADILPPAQPLVQGKGYYLRIDISAESSATNVVNPVPIPPAVLERIPEGAPLDVVVYSQDFKILEEGTHSGRQELRLPSGHRASDFVYVRVIAPDRPGTADLEVCIFYQNTLLQWLRTRARVVPPGEKWDALYSVDQLAAHLSTLARFGVTTVTQLALSSDHDMQRLAQELNVPVDTLDDWRDQAEALRQLGNESRVVYTISPTFKDLEALESPTVTVLFDGSRGEIKVKGPGKSPPPCQVDSGLRNSLLEFRKAMAEINEKSPEVYAFQPDNEGDRVRIFDHLLRMADMGRTLYNAVFNDGDVRKYLRGTLEKEGTIEISQISSEHSVVPWSALYDLRLIEEWEAKQEGIPRQVCMWWTDEKHQKKIVREDGSIQHELDYKACSSGERCPRRQDGRNAAAYKAPIHCYVCVYGFWGFKHRLQQPLGSREGQENPETLPQLIPVTERPRVNVIGNRKIDYYPTPHREDLAGLQEGPMKPDFVFADTAPEIRNTIRDPDLHALYFYCHGDVHRSSPRLIVGDDDVFITGDTLSNWTEDNKWENAPLVFINGCETITYSAESLTSMALQFRGLNASGVIGTEIKVFPMLARWFGKQFMQRFLDGEPVGKIMLDLRRELLKKYNPLGLIYTNHTLAGLRLMDRKLALRLSMSGESPVP